MLIVTYCQLPHELLARPDLSAGAKLAWAMLSDRQAGNGSCWPSLRRLAADVGLSVKATTRAVAELEAAGLLAVARRAGKGGVTPNHYCVRTDSAECTRNDSAGCVRNDSAGDSTAQAKCTHSVCESPTPRVCESHTEPTKRTTQENHPHGAGADAGHAADGVAEARKLLRAHRFAGGEHLRRAKADELAALGIAVVRVGLGLAERERWPAGVFASRMADPDELGRIRTLAAGSAAAEARQRKADEQQQAADEADRRQREAERKRRDHFRAAFEALGDDDRAAVVASARAGAGIIGQRYLDRGGYWTVAAPDMIRALQGRALALGEGEAAEAL
ncbi:MAG: helix-turn-helix domain-containing protein [Phycisphaerae bacterium]